MFQNPLQINARTRCCAVYGHPVAHSASPAMHNAAFRNLGLNCVYLAFDVLPHRLKEAVRGAQEMKFLGLNLTVPHKLLAFEIVDVLDTSAKDWGAVNTIRFEAKDKNGEWKPLIEFEDELPEEIRSHGFNTDAEAITLALYEDFGLVPNGIKMLLLGAGGAGRVAALKLASCGVKKIYIVNRTQEKAMSLAEEIKTKYPDVLVDLGYPEEKIDLVLNATSLGLKSSDPLPLDLSMFNFNSAALAYDMIYRPAETPFLRMAKQAGCKIANGLSMLLWQGVKALEIWINQPAPKEVMRDALIKNIYYGDH
ncbi:MAG: shikimate dehydrogenase family protein [Verrucomicrobiia bacterium]